MKKGILAVLCLAVSIALFAQEKMYIHKSDNFTLGALISSTDSIYFSNDGNLAYFRLGSTLAQYPVADIDSITFGENSNTIYITYNGSSVKVINPLAFEGVSVVAEGADVTVTSTSASPDIKYNLTGITADGMFKIYSDSQYILQLNGVNITNPDWPAINIQSEMTTSVEILNGTVNTLTDGVNYADPAINGNGETEDQDGAFFSEGRLVFSGSGNLTINGLGADQHALCSDDFIEINGGIITVSSAVKDGIHANDGLTIAGGTINVTATKDAIDGDTGNVLISGGSITTLNIENDVKGISCDGTLTISGGTLDLTLSGDQSKALKSDLGITLSGGNITIHTSGDAVLEPSGSGYDPSYCTAIKCDASISVSGAIITIVSTGKAGKAISSDADILITAGTINITSSGNGATYTNSSGVADAYVATCLSADGDIIIDGGSLTTTSSGSAGKGISADGTLTIGSSNNTPIVNITTTGTRILISGSGSNAVYAEAKAVKSDGDVSIDNGTINIASADDGIKSETSIAISNATLTITNSVEGLEAPYININSGNVSVKSSDDCLNATFGGGGEANDGSILTFNGGNTLINTTGGDGLDSNGNIIINGGTIIVHGPPSAPEVGMDYNGTCSVNGGLLVISGTNSNMTQAPGNSSAQYSIKAMSNTSLSSATLFHLQNASAEDVVTFQPMRNYYSIIFSSSDLQNGATYSIYTGGTCTGTNTNGLYSGGTYSGGTFKKTFTISNKVTRVNF
ncbi:MAG: carbohydrate-binding domain-containing protein [Lentimicrobium sp.]|nr:carbohydrate-binding domain-containing protein [Lentimicrobium sp.]